MNTIASRAFVWRTAVISLLAFDYFLFVTGNPSITYSVFGGWFEITLVMAVTIVGFYAYDVLKKRAAKRSFVIHLLVVALLSAALLSASSYARESARNRLEAEIASFVKDPAHARGVISDETRVLMAQITALKHSEEREAFIPTFRRMDYLFKTEVGAKYRLIITISWNGTPEISLRPVNS